MAHYCSRNWLGEVSVFEAMLTDSTADTGSWGCFFLITKCGGGGGGGARGDVKTVRFDVEIFLSLKIREEYDVRK